MALAEALGLEVAQTFGVSSIADLATFCTSIVARVPTVGSERDQQIVHVRNLDFYGTETMKQLLYEAILVFDGEEKARAPDFAGFYGFFTGRKEGAFSVSYNVRERAALDVQEELRANLMRNLEADRVPQGTAIKDALLHADSFDDAVSYFSKVKMTSAGHFIVGGVQPHEGTVLSRSADSTDHVEQLGLHEGASWFLVMTNVDGWKVYDQRYAKAVQKMNSLTSFDSKVMIEQVLWAENVLRNDSIYSADVSAHNAEHRMLVYNAPSERLWLDNPSG